MRTKQLSVTKLRWVGLSFVLVGVILTYLAPAFFTAANSALFNEPLVNGLVYFVGQIVSQAFVPVGAAIFGASLVLQGLQRHD